MAGDAGLFVWEGCGKTIRFIDMFAGIGGFREGLTRTGGFVCVGHCECDKYAERSYYAHADAMLVTLMDDPFISLTLPGKVQTYMAAGKPIIASAVGETPLVIDEAKCGYCAKANDAQALADVVRTFMHCSNKLQLGKNARAYYEQHFSKRTFMDRLEKELQMN